MTTPKFNPVTSIPLSSLTSTPFSIQDAPPAIFRFVDIPTLLQAQDPALKILSTPTLPSTYAAVSYVWSGLAPLKDAPQDTLISVNGLSSKDSLSMLTLVASVAQNHHGCQYLWIDKLCVRQDKEAEATDKPWQVQHMYDIYKNCAVCLVAPGGMTRLPALGERTTWADRAWTLQEALAPGDVKVLLRWEGKAGVLQHNSFCPVEVVAKGVGEAPLKALLECSLKPEVLVIREGEKMDWENGEKVRVGLFKGEGEAPFVVTALLGALDHEEGEGRLNAVWRCLIMRSAKFREDLIYSSMGIMGVTVDGKGIKDGSDYDDKQVTKLLIRLVQELIKNGRKAEWLGLAPSLGTAKGHSALPPLPLKSNVGGGFVEVDNGKYVEVKANFAENGTMDSWWWLKNAPQGQYDDDGNFTFTAKAMPVEESTDKTEYTGYVLQSETPERLVNCSTHRAWNIVKSSKGGKSLAIVVGKKELYTSGIFSSMVDPTTTLLMLVQDRGHGVYQNVGYAWGDESIDNEWSEKELTVGE